MYDINLYQNAYNLKKQVERKQLTSKEALATLERLRRKLTPTVYNIETTNICNMKCKICPRTTLMTRKIGTMKMALFEKIVSQLKPWTRYTWLKWIAFLKNEVKIINGEMNENHFFYYIVPNVITLHGFGEPLLDKYIVDRVKCLTNHKLLSYFSCHPLNISYDKAKELFDVNLTYLKFSTENADHFLETKQLLKDILKLNEKYETQIIIDVVGDSKGYEKIKNIFSDYSIYIYLKSRDNQWYAGTKKKTPVKHLSNFCQFPWSSMTILYDGTIVPCNQDFNAETKLGNANKNSLIDIWNSEKYKEFRKSQLTFENIPKCIKRCDMSCLIGEI